MAAAASPCSATHSPIPKRAFELSTPPAALATSPLPIGVALPPAPAAPFRTLSAAAPPWRPLCAEFPALPPSTPSEDDYVVIAPPSGRLSVSNAVAMLGEDSILDHLVGSSLPTAEALAPSEWGMEQDIEDYLEALDVSEGGDEDDEDGWLNEDEMAWVEQQVRATDNASDWLF